MSKSSSYLGDTYRNAEEGSFGVLNFRDLAISTEDSDADHKKYLKKGMVFRSATLDNMSQEDVDDFIKAHDIKTILDLRSSFEGREGLPIDKSFPTTALENFSASAVLDDDSAVVKTEKFDTMGKGTLIRKKYRIDFAGKNFQRYCVFGACNFLLKIYIVLLMAFCQRKQAAYAISRNVLAKMGVKKMYKEFAIYCQAEVLEALMVFTKPENYPIEIHCTQGKDRTGIVSALVLYIAGVPKDLIITDYAKTQKGLAPIYESMVEDVKRAGLSEDFAQAPPQNMRELFNFLEEKYGSIEKYLDQVGFNQELRDCVRKIICI